jgi:hypothetical protein
MTQQSLVSSFGTDLLDKAFYQSDNVKNHDIKRIDETGFNFNSQKAYISNLEQTLEAQQKVLDDFCGNTSQRSYFIFVSLCFLFVGSVAFISYELALKLTNASTGDQVASALVSSIIMFLPNLFGAAALTDVINAWRLKRFKKTIKGKKITDEIEYQNVQLERAYTDLDEWCQSKMTETYFFQTLKKFDDITNKLKKRYPENFLQFCDNSDNLAIEFLRNTLVEHFSNKDSHDFCSMAENIDNLEASFESAWKNYCSTDKAMLMKKYEHFLNHDTSEIENIL